MSKIKELEKRVENLESELNLLKELVKLQSKAQERYVPAPILPYYIEPHLKPPYEITCERRLEELGIEL